jgi:hypothetical protein
MARYYRRRRNGGIVNFLSNIFDDVYDFVDDEILDRGWDAERDLRRAGRNWTDSYDDDYYDDRSRRARRRSYRRYEIEDLRDAVAVLSRTISVLELTGSIGDRSTSRSGNARREAVGSNNRDRDVNGAQSPELELTGS